MNSTSDTFIETGVSKGRVTQVVRKEGEIYKDFKRRYNRYRDFLRIRGQEKKKKKRKKYGGGFIICRLVQRQIAHQQNRENQKPQLVKSAFSKASFF